MAANKNPRKSRSLASVPGRTIIPVANRPVVTPDVTEPPALAPAHRHADQQENVIRRWQPRGISQADKFRQLPEEERRSRLAALTTQEADALLHDWSYWRRPTQALPPGRWVTWIILAGRGFGKSRTGAEVVRQWVREFPMVNLIGATADDARDIMIEGESGILACCPADERPTFRKTERKLIWPNGAISLIFTADEPERLRGKQHMKLWADEVAAWRYAESWAQAKLGLRLGANPQIVATTTPKPTALVKEIIYDATTIVTRGTTYENKENLSPVFLAEVVRKYEGTRLGRQELNAEILEANPGALWKQEMIDNDRVDPDYFWREIYPNLARIVVAIDPPASSNEDSDECGIVTVGRDKRNPQHFYVFDDRSDILSPNEWALKGVNAYKSFKADRIVGEINNGGEMVESTVHHVDVNVPFKSLHASKGKITRAEPVAALYEQHRVHHVGIFGALEDQCCDYDPATATFSPDRMDALVWACTELMEGMDVLGLIDYYRSGRADAELSRLEALDRQKMKELSELTTTGAIQAELIPPDTNVAASVVRAKVLGCPQCHDTLIQKVCGQLRCAACGHQWWPGNVAPEVAYAKRTTEMIEDANKNKMALPQPVGGMR